MEGIHSLWQCEPGLCSAKPALKTLWILLKTIDPSITSPKHLDLSLSLTPISLSSSQINKKQTLIGVCLFILWLVITKPAGFLYSPL